jgi:hypothetical protein
MPVRPIAELAVELSEHGAKQLTPDVDALVVASEVRRPNVPAPRAAAR